MKKQVFFFSLLALLLPFSPALAALSLDDIAQDLESLSQTKEVDVKNIRYFRLTGREEERSLQLQALTLVLNNLSLTSEIFYPKIIDKHDNSIVRISLAQLGNEWISKGMNEGLWTKLIEKNYPYVEAETKEKNTPLAQIVGGTQSSSPLIRADWFIWKSSTWSFYATAMNWPKTLKKFRKKFSSQNEKSIARQIRDNNGVQGLFLSQNNEQIHSFTSFIAKPRLYLERQSSRNNQNPNYMAYVGGAHHKPAYRTISLNTLHKHADEAKKSTTRFVYILRRNGLIAMAKFNNGKLVTDSNSSVWEEIDENHPIDTLKPTTLLISKINGSDDYKKRAERFFGDAKILSYRHIERELNRSADAYEEIFEANAAARQKEAKKSIAAHLNPIPQIVKNYTKNLSLEQVKSELGVTEAELKSIDLEKAPQAVQSFFLECGRALCTPQSEFQFSRSYLEKNYRALRGSLKNETYTKQSPPKQSESLESQKNFETLLTIARKRFNSDQEARVFLKKLNIEKTFNFRRIEPGIFKMGAPEDEEGRQPYESEEFIRIEEAYEIGLTEVTQGLWVLVMGKFRIPPSFQGRSSEVLRIKQDHGDFEEVKVDYRRPVENITWFDIQKFVKKLNQFTGQNYRLPTNQEWEYAARAGTSTPFNFVKEVETPDGEATRYIGAELSTHLANFNGHYPYKNGEKGEFREKTVEVASFPPNRWGLYDIHGNVSEWVLDSLLHTTVLQKNAHKIQNDPKPVHCHITRGGHWSSKGKELRSAAQNPGLEQLSDKQGFRLVRTFEK